MADNVNGKKIKDLTLATSLADTNDFIVEDATPTTKRVRWSTIVSTLKSAFGIAAMQEQLDTMNEIYVAGSTLYEPSSVASVSGTTLNIGTGGKRND